MINPLQPPAELVSIAVTEQGNLAAMCGARIGKIAGAAFPSEGEHRADRLAHSASRGAKAEDNLTSRPRHSWIYEAQAQMRAAAMCNRAGACIALFSRSVSEGRDVDDEEGDATLPAALVNPLPCVSRQIAPDIGQAPYGWRKTS